MLLGYPKVQKQSVRCASFCRRRRRRRWIPKFFMLFFSGAPFFVVGEIWFGKGYLRNNRKINMEMYVKVYLRDPNLSEQ